MVPTVAYEPHDIGPPKNSSTENDTVRGGLDLNGETHSSSEYTTKHTEDPVRHVGHEQTNEPAEHYNDDHLDNGDDSGQIGIKEDG